MRPQAAKESSERLLCASLRSRKLGSRKERSRKEKVKEGKVKEVLCRSGAARASSSAAFPKQQLGERSRIVVAAQFALAHPRGGSQQEGRKKEEGIPPAEAAHHDVSADHPEAAW